MKDKKIRKEMVKVAESGARLLESPILGDRTDGAELLRAAVKVYNWYAKWDEKIDETDFL